MPLWGCGQLSAADPPHAGRTVLVITGQAVDAVQLLALLFNGRPVLAMLRSGKQVVACVEMDRVLGKQLWGLARDHLNKVAKAEGLVWVIDLRLIHLNRRHG